MMKTSREFQVFAKPVGPVCNLECHYCYYLEKKRFFPENTYFRMPENILEEYIVQHINASTGPVITFSWHGGEPLLAGLDYFRRITQFQKKHLPLNRRIINGIQTNGTMLDDAWCRFFASENFIVGISIDGPQKFHDLHRLTRNKKSTFQQTVNGYHLLREYGILCEILCVVNADNVKYPREVYGFYKELNASYLTFLPVVERDGSEGVTSLSVPSESFGNFLISVFDEWMEQDIGKVKVQIIEEAARSAFGQDHTLCIFKKTCGNVPVVEHNGAFYSCDHFVEPDHFLGNIMDIPLADLLDSPDQAAFGRNKLDSLPQYCLECDVRDMCNGGCPKNRFIRTP
ncbi:MAG: anaerobic sulfatase maturase, partial [Bacteroidales bacterium]